MGLAGLPLGLFGLWLTWKQAREAKTQASEAKTAAEAAELAVRRTQTQVRAQQLLVLIPQLRWISTELDAAIEDDNRRLVRRHLDNWRWQANNIHGMLTATDPAQRKLLKGLQTSVGQASSAGTALMSKGNISILQESASARESIGAVCDQLSGWVGENVSKVAEDDYDH